MTLDMTGGEFGVLSYKMNDKDLGPAFDKIDMNGEYRMAVSIFHDDNLQLILE